MGNYIKTISIDPKSPSNHPVGSKPVRRQGAYAIFIVGLLSPLGPLLAQDQTPAPAPPQIEKKQLDALTPAIQRKFEELKIWGLAIAVGRAGHILYEHGFGFRDADKLKPIDPETHFEIGSITKQFTAAAILQLKEQGKLSLDDALAKYVPTFPHGSEISIRQLLNQTSGLVDYFAVRGFDEHELGGFEKIVNLIEKEPLKFVPGESFAYSNTNYIALGRVVEVVSGESYRRYIQRHLFDPAGMSQSTTIAEENAVENMAVGFANDPNEPDHIVPALRFSPGLAWSAGYIVSTVGDLEKWDTALRNGRIISPTDYALMTKPFKPSSGVSAHYGFGLIIDTYIEHGSFNDHPRFWHAGGTWGFSAGNFVFPNEDLDFLILTNQGDRFPGIVDIAGKVFETIFPAPPPVDPDLPAAGEDPEVTKRFTELLNALMEGTVDRGQLSPELRTKVSPEQLQNFAAKFKSLGKPSKIIFKKQSNSEHENIFVYRVDFWQEHLNFVLQINKESDLIDTIYPPISLRD